MCRWLAALLANAKRTCLTPTACRHAQNGHFVDVTVDSYFPVDDDGQPLFSHTGADHELWVLVLEKAYAKVRSAQNNQGWRRRSVSVSGCPDVVVVGVCVMVIVVVTSSLLLLL